jgi:hypothetical protein
MSEPTVVRWTFLSLQVCVPKTFTDTEAEVFANHEHPTGIESQWSVCDRMEQRVQCLEHEENCHIALDC